MRRRLTFKPLERFAQATHAPIGDFLLQERAAGGDPW